jgi:DNA-binding transcriptional regulator of glucitol operon
MMQKILAFVVLLVALAFLLKRWQKSLFGSRSKTGCGGGCGCGEGEKGNR